MVSVVQAGDHPDLNGIWIMDLKDPESTSMATLLRAQGASWMECKLADSIAVTQKITQTEKTLMIEVDGGFGKRTEVLKLDGIPETTYRERVGAVEIMSFWSEDGKKVVTIAKYTTKNGKKALWTIERYLGDSGKKLKVDHLLKIEGSAELKATRVLLKQD
jgi:hypothetical protein